jgi:hypothetical protein
MGAKRFNFLKFMVVLLFCFLSVFSQKADRRTVDRTKGKPVIENKEKLSVAETTRLKDGRSVLLDPNGTWTFPESSTDTKQPFQSLKMDVSLKSFSISEVVSKLNENSGWEKTEFESKKQFLIRSEEYLSKLKVGKDQRPLSDLVIVFNVALQTPYYNYGSADCKYDAENERITFDYNLPTVLWDGLPDKMPELRGNEIRTRVNFGAKGFLSFKPDYNQASYENKIAFNLPSNIAEKAISTMRIAYYMIPVSKDRNTPFKTIDFVVKRIVIFDSLTGNIYKDKVAEIVAN